LHCRGDVQCFLQRMDEVVAVARSLRMPTLTVDASASAGMRMRGSSVAGVGVATALGHVGSFASGVGLCGALDRNRKFAKNCDGEPCL